MTTQVTEQVESTETTSWSPTVPAVRKALQFIRRQGSVTAEELVAWDASHGRKLFQWNDDAAAEQWRLQQARFFLNSFRSVVDGMRVRKFIHVLADEETGQEAGYLTSEAISKSPTLRAGVIKEVTKRMKSLASELKMWKLEEVERHAIFAQLDEAMGFDMP